MSLSKLILFLLFFTVCDINCILASEMATSIPTDNSIRTETVPEVVSTQSKMLGEVESSSSEEERA